MIFKVEMYDEISVVSRIDMIIDLNGVILHDGVKRTYLIRCTKSK